MGTVNLGPQPTAIELSRRLRAEGLDGYADAALAAHWREVRLRGALQQAAADFADVADLKPRYRESAAVRGMMRCREALGEK